MSKYIDLADRIHDSNVDVYPDEIRAVLFWLDTHPDQVPGRTITQSEADAAFDHRLSDDPAFNRTELLKRLGATVIPDPEPEPTNAEKLEQLHDQYRMFPAQHLPGNGSFADYLDHKGVKAPDHD